MRILIVKLSSIGDVVHTLPAAAALRRALPGAHIAWAVERRAGAILKDSPVIDELIEVDTRAWRKRPWGQTTMGDVRACLDRVRGRFDVAIDLQGLIKSGVVAYASGAPRRVGFQTGELRERAAAIFLTEQVETRQLRHVIDKNLALSHAVMADQPGPLHESEHSYEFPISVSAEDDRYIDEAVGSQGKPLAIINPGGGWGTKLWPAASYGQVADWLMSEYGFVSLVTYGPGEEDLARRVAAGSRSGAALPLASTLKQFVALARRAKLFIGGDTGPLHLAAACRTPIVGLYGPTSPERNGPFDKRDVTVGRDLWCRTDCHRRSCWHWECMAIPFGEVQRAVAARMSEAKLNVRYRGLEVSREA